MIFSEDVWFLIITLALRLVSTELLLYVLTGSLNLVSHMHLVVTLMVRYCQIGIHGEGVD